MLVFVWQLHRDVLTALFLKVHGDVNLPHLFCIVIAKAFSGVFGLAFIRTCRMTLSICSFHHHGSDIGVMCKYIVF